MEKETWRDIPDYEGLYQVSTLGRIKSLERKIIRSNGRVFTIKEKILKDRIGNSKRPYVALFKDQKRKDVMVHTLVALAFIGERPKDYQVLHKDGDILNNRLENLSYDTRQQNAIDFYRYGQNGSNGKLSTDDVVKIRKLYKSGDYLQRELSDLFGVTQNQTSRIVNKKRYSWLENDGTIKESQTKII